MNERSTILMVDDDPEMLASLRRVLATEVYQFVTTEDPRRVAELLRQHRVAAVISDIEMPWIDGIEVLELARELQPWAGRIIVSGAGTLSYALRAINNGAVHHYIEKPFDPARLRDVVRSVVSTQAQVGELVARVQVRTKRRDQLTTEHPDLMQVERTAAGVYRVNSARARSSANGTVFEHLVRTD